jgi:hypothetical protein
VASISKESMREEMCSKTKSVGKHSNQKNPGQQSVEEVLQFWMKIVYGTHGKSAPDHQNGSRFRSHPT